MTALAKQGCNRLSRPRRVVVCGGGVAAIEALLLAGQADQLQLQRLKKRKLLLRDRLTQLEDALTPDIIA